MKRTQRGVQGEGGGGGNQGDRTIAELAVHFGVHPNQTTTGRSNCWMVRWRRNRQGYTLGRGSGCPTFGVRLTPKNSVPELLEIVRLDPRSRRSWFAIENALA
jgi:transposase-like protein